MAKITGRTVYTERIKGDEGNHGRDAQFDLTDGYLGITDFEDRVLLSPAQVKALVNFVVGKKARAA
jgi:hypothetical protein